MKCEDCCHAEMCKWIDELEGRGCDFFDGEQEPCDAISREYLFKVLDDFCGHDRTATITLDTLADIVYELPSVTQKSGKWINDKDDMPICSQCGYIPQYDRAIDDYEYSNYCPSCGTKMVEPQERSDKDER